MNLFQWLFIGFCFLQLLLALRRVRRWRRWQGWFFVFFWVGAAVLLMFPSLSTLLAAKLGIGRGVDLVLYALCFFFMWAHYQHYVRYKHLEECLTVLVRELAIERAQSPKPRPSSDGQAKV